MKIDFRSNFMNKSKDQKLIFVKNTFYIVGGVNRDFK
jgi:hypothetical protein